MTSVPYTDKFPTPTSVAISCIWYDDDTQNLYLQFKNGTFAGYTGVPKRFYEGFRQTDSVGRYYNRDFARQNFNGATLPQSPYLDERTSVEEFDDDVYQVSVMVTVTGAENMGRAVDKVAAPIKAAGFKIDKVRVVLVD